MLITKYLAGAFILLEYIFTRLSPKKNTMQSSSGISMGDFKILGCKSTDAYLQHLSKVGQSPTLVYFVHENQLMLFSR